MKIHYIQHVSFEDLASMEKLLVEKGHTLSSSHLYKREQLPPLNDFDWLIIMGGPMGIYDYDKHPWLKKEKQFIKASIDAGKIVLGICLGAQLIADVLGTKVYKNEHKEIGWFTITPSAQISTTILADIFTKQMDVFHWHGDTFLLPENAVAIGHSEACKNQGFILNDRVLALQFHLETNIKSATALIENSKTELDIEKRNNSKYVQSERTMIENETKFQKINVIMKKILGALENSKNRN